jgi:hypothetical protein
MSTRSRTYRTPFPGEPEPELFAMFGEARILKHLADGRLEIRGGTDAEKAQAHAWMKQFLPSTPVPRDPTSGS